jgi:hypothetical protein
MIFVCDTSNEAADSRSSKTGGVMGTKNRRRKVPES